MTYNFDDHLDYILEAYYAECEYVEEVVYDTYMVVYTYADGIKCNEIMNQDELCEDYKNIFELEEFEDLVKYEVYNMIKDWRGYDGYVENELLYSEKL